MFLNQMILVGDGFLAVMVPEDPINHFKHSTPHRSQSICDDTLHFAQLDTVFTLSLKINRL